MSKMHNNAAGIIIENRSVLMVRAIGKDFFISPGGGIEDGETAEMAVCRELEEELTVKIAIEDLVFFGLYKVDATGHPGDKIRMRAFLINKYEGTLTPSMEVEEYGWFNSYNMHDRPIGSIFENYVIPELREQNLID